MTIFPPISQGAVDAAPITSKLYPFLSDNELVPYVDQLSVFLYDKQPKFLRIGSIAGLGQQSSSATTDPTNNAVDLTLLDTAGDVVIDTRAMMLTAKLWHDDIWHLAWKNRYESVQLICRRGSSLQAVYAPNNAYIDARCVHASPLGINRVEVFSAGYWTPAMRSDGTLRFRLGYNMEFTTKSAISARGERVADWFIDAVPGAGLGRFEGCLTAAPIRKIVNQAPTDAGEFFLTGDPCLTVKPVFEFGSDTVKVVDGKLELDDLCEPPCTCDDFTEVYQYAKRVWEELKRRAARAEAIRDDYHQVRAVWMNLAQCAESNLLRVKAWPQRGCGIIGIVGFCNPTDDVIRDVTLKINVRTDEDVDLPGNLLCESVTRVDYDQGDNFPAPYVFEEGFPNAKVQLKCIPPGQMSYVSFQYTPDGLEDGDTVRLCVELDSECPVGIRDQTRRCYDTKLLCKPEENCNESLSSTTTAAPTEYLTQTQADDLYINTDSEEIDGGAF